MYLLPRFDENSNQILLVFCEGEDCKQSLTLLERWGKVVYRIVSEEPYQADFVLRYFCTSVDVMGEQINGLL